MKYRGAYDDSASYNVDDVVVFTDGIPYCLQKPAPVSTGCHDTLYWYRLPEEYADMVVMFHSFFMSLQASAAEAAETTEYVNEILFDKKTIVLESSTESSTTKYAVTVDDEDGLAATAIVEEAEGGDT